MITRGRFPQHVQVVGHITDPADAPCWSRSLDCRQEENRFVLGRLVLILAHRRATKERDLRKSARDDKTPGRHPQSPILLRNSHLESTSDIRSEILLRSGLNSTPEDRARDWLVGMVEGVHEAFYPVFVDLSGLGISGRTTRQEGKDQSWILSLRKTQKKQEQDRKMECRRTSPINTLTASSVA